MKNWHTLGAWGPLKMKESSVAWCCTREPEVQRDIRGSKRLWVPEKETGKPLYLGNYMYKAREDISSASLRGLQNLYPGWLVKVFPCTKAVCKEWERWLFFQIPKSQQNITRHMKQQRNMTQSCDTTWHNQINLQKLTLRNGNQLITW